MKVRVNVYIEPDQGEGHGQMQVYQTIDLGPWTWQELGEVLGRLNHVSEYLQPRSGQ